MFTYCITYYVPGTESIIRVSAPFAVDALKAAFAVAESLPTRSVRSIVREEPK